MLPKYMRMDKGFVEWNAKKQEAREKARAIAGDAWTGMAARIEKPETTEKHVASELAAWRRRQAEAQALVEKAWGVKG